MAKFFAVSASQLNDWDKCQRSWFLRYVLRVKEDVKLGPDGEELRPSYLQKGDDFDLLIQAWSAKMDPPDGTPELALRQLAAARPHLPRQKSAQIQFKYRVPVPGLEGVFITGKPDLRESPGHWCTITDTKTTSDRGPGKGKDKDTPPYALTNETLARDTQARLYAWAEFQLNPALKTTQARWIYVSKADSPQSWVAECVFHRAEVEAWFESYARPRVLAMRAMALAYEDQEVPGLVTENDVPANHDACARCFVRLSCNPFVGAQKQEVGNMVLDLKKLRSGQAAGGNSADEMIKTARAQLAGVDLTATLAASVAAVAINRPKTFPAVAGRPELTADLPGDEVVDVTESTANPVYNPASQFSGHLDDTLGPAEPESAAAIAAELDAAEAEAPPAPKRRPGRPRKGAAPSGGTAAQTAPIASGTDAARKALITHLEDLASQFQSFSDRADRAVADIDKALATLRAGGA